MESPRGTDLPPTPLDSKQDAGAVEATTVTEDEGHWARVEKAGSRMLANPESALRKFLIW